MMLTRLAVRSSSLSLLRLTVPLSSRTLASSTSSPAPPTTPTDEEVEEVLRQEALTHPSSTPVKRRSSDSPIPSLTSLFSVGDGTASSAIDALKASNYKPEEYHPDIDRAMKEWRKASGTETFDGEESVMPPRGPGEEPTGEPRVWSYRALTQNKLPGSAPPPNPYRSRIEYPPLAKLVTSKVNPARHTADDALIGRIYHMPENLDALFPEGMAGDLKAHFQVTGENALLVPPSGVKLVQQLEAYKAATDSVTDPEALEAAKKDVPSFTLLNGARGIGKSVLLNYLVQYARDNGWLCLFIPDCLPMLKDGLVLTESTRTPGMIDQHDIAMSMLRAFLTAHGDKLGDVPQRGAYPKDRYLTPDLDEIAVAAKEQRFAEEAERRRRLKAETEAAGKVWDPSTEEVDLEERSTDIDRSQLTLKDMVEWGISHPAAATDTLLDLKAELAMVTEFPVMIAMDSIESLYPESLTEYPWEGDRLPADRLTIPSAFRMLNQDGFFDHEHKLQRGVVVAAMSYKHQDKPLRKLLKSGLKKSIQHKVPSLSRWQIYALLSHFHQTERFLMLQEEVSPDTVEFFRTLTAGRPADLASAAMFAL